MAGNVVKGNEIPTIDVTLVSILPYREGADEIILDTANQIQVTVATETQDKVPLIVKGRLIAQKPAVTTVTGNTIVLSDNVFNPEVVMILQGGTVEYDTDGKTFKKYTPPVAGEAGSGELFRVKAYSTVYDAAGVIQGYECITYPNCQGTPVALSSQDGVFRVAEYTINSAPANGEAPYEIEMVKALPTVTGATS